MEVIKNFADFLVSAWLWNLTFAFSYVFIIAFCMMLLLKIVARESFFKAFLLSVTAQIVTVIFFAGIVVGIIIHLFNWHYYPEGISPTLTRIDALRACLSLGIVYALIQTLFFWLIESHLKGNVFTYIIICWTSNALASVLCYWLIKWVMGASL